MSEIILFKIKISYDTRAELKNIRALLDHIEPLFRSTISEINCCDNDGWYFIYLREKTFESEIVAALYKDFDDCSWVMDLDPQFSGEYDAS